MLRVVLPFLLLVVTCCATAQTVCDSMSVMPQIIYIDQQTDSVTMTLTHTGPRDASYSYLSFDFADTSNITINEISVTHGISGPFTFSHDFDIIYKNTNIPPNTVVNANFHVFHGAPIDCHLPVVFIINATGQGPCIADAGNDTVLCVSDAPGAFYLGGSPAVTGGTPPYTYAWSYTYNTSGMTFTASDFLDDTTIANPQLIDVTPDPAMTFHLTVTDSAGNMCNDDITIQLSNWEYTLDEKIAFINPGDSVQLYKSIYGGIPPLTYQWSPATDLADPADVNTWAKPDTTTFYTLLATDAMGCQGSDLFKVYVYPAGMNNLNDRTHIDIYPNPFHHKLVIDVHYSIPEETSISILDLAGHELYRINNISSKSILNLEGLSPGIYFIRLHTPAVSAVRKAVKR